MYPVKFNKILKEKVWGGKNFDYLFHFNLPRDTAYGESWEVSSHKNGESTVSNGALKGLTINQLLENYNSDFAGEEIISKYGKNFPLLVKYLDINDKLSVQVHPDNSYALRTAGEFGKFESWYIIEASPDAKIILGTKEGVTRKEFQKKVLSGDFSNLFNEIPVKKGDFLDVKPGLVHASISGSILICEIQQNSDLTYRIYDFDRETNGVKRNLHVKESLEVIDFDLKPVITHMESRKKTEIKNGFIEELTRNEFYSIDKITLSGGFYIDPEYKNFKIFSILNGKGIIKSTEYSGVLEKGQTFYVPPNTRVELLGSFELLKSYI